MTTDAVDIKNLAGTLGCVVPICAIPFAGAVCGLGLGMAGVIMGGSKARQTRRHLREGGQTPLDGLRVGAEARLRGEVLVGETVRAPLGDRDAAFVEGRLLRTTSNVGDKTELWSKRWVAPFAIRGDAFIAQVRAGHSSLLTHGATRRKWEGEPPAEVAAIMGNAAARLDTTYRDDGTTREYAFEYVESAVAAGDEVTVTGKVEEAQEERGAGEGYRDHALTMKVALYASLVTSMSDEHLRRRLGKAREMYWTGVISLGLAALNVAVSWWWFLG